MPGERPQHSSLALRVALFFAAMFLIYGVQLPFFPSWLAAKGLSPSEIAIVAAAPMMIRMVATPGLALLADRLGAHGAMLCALAWTALGSALALSAVDEFYGLLGVSLVLAIAVSTLMPLTETIAMRGVRTEGLDYGRMRLWGSLTFILASLAGGVVVGRLGFGVVVWLLVAGAAATAVAAHVLAGVARPDAELAVPAPAPRRFAFAGGLGLLANVPFLLFLVAMGAVQAAHAVLYGFGSIHWQARGISAGWIGTLWSVGVVTEIMLFWWSRRAAQALGPLRLMLIGASAAVVRWLAMAFDPPLAALVPLQALHGATYAASHLGSVHFIAAAVPERHAATAQALYATVSGGLAMGLAMLAAGPLYAAYGQRSFLAMALLALAGLGASLLLARRWGGGALVAG